MKYKVTGSNPVNGTIKISGSKMDLKSLFRYFITKEKLAFALILYGFVGLFTTTLFIFATTATWNYFSLFLKYSSTLLLILSHI